MLKSVWSTPRTQEQAASILYGEQAVACDTGRERHWCTGNHGKLAETPAQCAKAAHEACTVLGQLTRAFHYRDSHTFIGLYEQYALPYFEFVGPGMVSMDSQGQGNTGKSPEKGHYKYQDRKANLTKEG
jgi:hypothetical protein